MWPVLFRVRSLDIHSYGVMLMLAFIAGILLSRRQARRAGLSPDVPVDLGLWILVASIVLARLVYVALNWNDPRQGYASHPIAALQVWREGGLSYYGGLLGGVLAAALYARRTRNSFGLLADTMAPGLALGYAIARIGCFLNGCCYGSKTSLPWAVPFADAAGIVAPRHPTQLYASLGSLIILAALLWLQPRLKARGRLFLSYLMLYAVLRSIVEVFRRGATADVVFRGITQAQLTSALLFLIAAVAFVLLGRRREAKAEPAPSRRKASPAPRRASAKSR